MVKGSRFWGLFSRRKTKLITELHISGGSFEKSKLPILIQINMESTVYLGLMLFNSGQTFFICNSLCSNSQKLVKRFSDSDTSKWFAD